MHVPVITTTAGTMRTAADLYAVAPRLTRSSTRKIEAALRIFEEHVDGRPCSTGSTSARPASVTPLMFEHQLVDRARAASRHIVLPEGEEPASSRRPTRCSRAASSGSPCSATRPGSRPAPQLGLDIGGAELVDPRDEPLRSRFADEYAALRAHKGVTLEQAWTSSSTRATSAR